MSLRGYIKKGGPAPWVAAFPIQASALRAKIDREETSVDTRRREKRREDRAYHKEARLFVKAARKAGLHCPVVASISELRDGRRYGHQISARLNEVHHIFGRLGDLLRWQAGWVALSKAGHRWVHSNPAKARELGFLCQPGEWNRKPSELVKAAEKITKKISCTYNSRVL